MANGQLGLAIRQLRSFLGTQSARSATDGELLQRFAAQKDESAYAALVERYAPLVQGVCRRVLQNDHDAEDAFQATFLVLWRKAGSLDGRGTIGNWLYTVAYHLALKAKIRADQRRAHERQVAAMPDAETETEPIWQELRPLLDEELDRLPPKYRSPMVLCYLVGKTNDQAAEELGWTKDTVRGRLAKARELMRNRLTRRGVTMSAAALGTVLADHAAQAAVPVGWVDGTLKAAAILATGKAGGISSSVAMLADGLIKEMFVAKLKIAAAIVLAIGVATTGIGLSAQATKNVNASSAGSATSGPKARPARVGAKASKDSDKSYIVEPVENCPEDMDKEMEPESAMMPESEPAEEPAPARIAVKRRNWACEDELRKELLLFPELNLDADRRDRSMSRLIVERGTEPEPNQEKHFTPGLLSERPDLAGLPLRKGTDCELSETAARNLQAMSLELREVIGGSLGDDGDKRLVADGLRYNFRKGKKPDTSSGAPEKPFRDRYKEAAAVPVLMQMLPAEDMPVRQVLVEQLALIKVPASSQALAQLALFDTAPEVRADALAALAQRPREEYRRVLLNGFRYPWTPVADHAAEALVALQDKEAVSALRKLVDEPDPAAPFMDPEQGVYVVREVVRINHLRNCLMCHAPHTGENSVVRAPVPVPSQPLPPLFRYYNGGNDGIFVRAEATYLKQDFSVSQPVAKAHPWPALQRYDYLVRNRPISSREYAVRVKQKATTYPQREAVLFALKELAHD